MPVFPCQSRKLQQTNPPMLALQRRIARRNNPKKSHRLLTVASSELFQLDTQWDQLVALRDLRHLRLLQQFATRILTEATFEGEAAVAEDWSVEDSEVEVECHQEVDSVVEADLTTLTVDAEGTMDETKHSPLQIATMRYVHFLFILMPTFWKDLYLQFPRGVCSYCCRDVLSLRAAIAQQFLSKAQNQYMYM